MPAASDLEEQVQMGIQVTLAVARAWHELGDAKRVGVHKHRTCSGRSNEIRYALRVRRTHFCLNLWLTGTSPTITRWGHSCF